jgi:ankyrin repeat protein
LGRGFEEVSKTAIIAAVDRLDLTATRHLLRATPSLCSVTDRQGRNLLHLACSVPPVKRGTSGTAQCRMAGFLLDEGFEIDLPMGRDKCTPLFFAVARARNLNLVKLLLERGAAVSAAPGGGLYAAGWWQDLKILDALLKAGAQIDVVVGVTPFLACWGWKRFDAAKFLATKGADVNFRDRRGKTALHHGVEKEFDPALLKWLIGHGASADVEDGEGVSPRLRASRKRDKRYLAALT